ncbi:MAG TPA: DNA-formamidopyrimidine glycosylase family protein [Jatrophihabitans sp.]|jgi:formamidopyrimidine-DNA glycosylase
MPELPEVESARVVIEQHALNRAVVAIDDVDEYVCRPFRTDDFNHALHGRRFAAAHRHGKTLWLETSNGAEDAPELGLHLGMGGRVIVADDTGQLVVGGDSTHGLAGEYRDKWDRFTVHFEDGRSLRLVDKRRLGRAVLNPDLSGLGPDALQVRLPEFRQRLGSSVVAIKARLLDQSVIAGVGNLIADETLWRARINPSRRTADLTPGETSALHRCMRAALRFAFDHGGSHAGHVIPFRHPGGYCPRCHSPMQFARIGGRTTWSCSTEQV